MVKWIFLLVLIFAPITAGAEVNHLKLRSNQHTGVLRIVIEGPQTLIDSAVVSQRIQSVLVTFPGANFTIFPENVIVGYKKQGRETIALYPGEFRGLKVFSLKNPGRLVIDIHQDKESGFAPFFTDPAEGKREEKRKAGIIVIDPGHGGYESGIVKNGYHEKNVVLDIAKKLQARAGQGSSEVHLTRTIDLFMTQGERVESVNKRDADIFISLHIGRHREIVIYAPVVTERARDEIRPYLENSGQEGHLRDTALLLNSMKEAFVTEFGSDMVLIRPLPYSILSNVQAAAVMIELSSFDDAAYIEDFRAEVANVLYKGTYIYEENKRK
ncbi:MAG: hypothetical protein AMK70_09795 [Nitrospira bacterium SG8_35_1]|nr:MAG: hypothetical protein AMK70_09795 [Nitrospira bacterium SG8_35_1]